MLVEGQKLPDSEHGVGVQLMWVPFLPPLSQRLPSYDLCCLCMPVLATRILCGEENSFPHGAYMLEEVTENKNKERNTHAHEHTSCR